MSVVLINMKMPRCCTDCPMLDDNYDYPTCVVNGKSGGYTAWKTVLETRMDFCPLTEVGNETD